MSFQVGIGYLGGTVFFQVGLWTPLRTMSQGGNEKWELISKFVQFTGEHFSDITQNSYGAINNMKLDLNVTIKRSNLVQMTRDLSLKIRVITGFLITA